MYQAQKPIKTVASMKEILGEDLPSQTAKIIDHIDPHCRTWIEKTPFITIATCDANGNMDVSPKGDPAGFVKVLDEKTLAIPDRIGNHRGDSFTNIIENPRIGIMFTIPMRKEVIRVNGAAEVIMDDDILDMMVVNTHRPDLAILVHVEEAFFHCGKSMIRSHMWQPEKWGSIDGLSTYAEALKDHGALPDPVADLERRMAYNETDRLY
ncbi:MAG: MSMEG_1061 family FMN-dependent PPOX-type flavoprotein [Pseudomonadota bacterium]